MGTFVGVIAVVLTLACLLLSGSRCFSQTPSSPPAGTPSSPPAATAAEKVKTKTLDRKQVRAMLKKLANTPPPKQEPQAIAMCYSTAPPPTRADYVCPKCGERTIYDESDKLPPLEQAERGTAALVKWQIQVCRRDMQQIHKLAGDAVTLDESQFCRKCSPKTSSPKLVLHIVYDGGKPRDVDNIKHDDLIILRDFLAGKLVTKNDRDYVNPLQDDLPRLQELLGEEPDK
jgi:hypothetical protein